MSNALERIADDPVTSALWHQLADAVATLADVSFEGRKLYVRVSRHDRTFAEAAPRRAALVLVIHLPFRLVSARCRLQRQTSSRRWRNEVLVETGGDIDAELLGWLEEAHELAA